MKSGLKTAIVTGAGRGIGRAAAVELSRRGFHVVLVSRTKSQLQQTASLCRKVDVFPMDVADSAAIAKLIKFVFKKHNRIDAAVHCAGVVYSLKADEITDAQWHRTVDVNLSSAVYLARELFPIWKKRGGGVMVNVSSQAARDPFPGLGAYGAIKAGVNLLGLALAREGSPHNIRVHTVAPAATETEMLRSIASPEQLPTDQTMPPEAVANVICDCVMGSLSITSGEVIYVHKS